MEAGAFLDVADGFLRRGLGVRFRAEGRSMLPTIQPGEVLTVHPVRASDVRWGDVILFHSENGVIAHRVVRVVREAGEHIFLVRGDSVLTCDEPVRSGQLLGRVVSVEGNGELRPLTGMSSRIAGFAASLYCRMAGSVAANRRSYQSQ